MKILTLGIILLMGAGCTMPFSGKRDATCKINILGNTFEWTSTLSGEYDKKPKTQ